MPKASPQNGNSKRLTPRARVEENPKLVKFELNLNDTKILIESDNEKQPLEILDIIKDICESEAIKKFLPKK